HVRLRRPPPPTLFPYTPLFRSPAPLDCPDWIVRATWSRPCPGNGVSARCGIGTPEWFDGRRHNTSNEAQDNYLTAPCANVPGAQDRKSTRLNSSHVKISYAVFC